jgi:FKBP-type peptidyl-prolyl cis-trans isomerase
MRRLDETNLKLRTVKEENSALMERFMAQGFEAGAAQKRASSAIAAIKRELAEVQAKAKADIAREREAAAAAADQFRAEIASICKCAPLAPALTWILIDSKRNVKET